MAMVVKNNMSAVSTLNTLNKNSSALQKSLQKVSSGMKINSAQDDASGYAISEKMRVQIRSLDQANQNTQNASSLMKTAEGAVSSTVEILKSLKEKAINAATDTNTDSDRATIQKELDQFIDQIDDNALTTFNGKYLVDGSKNNAHMNTRSAFTNQSMAIGTTGSTYLADDNTVGSTDTAKNRTGESLEIASTDYVTASFVKDGKTYTTTYQVADTKIEDIFNNLNAEYAAKEPNATAPAFGPGAASGSGSATTSNADIIAAAGDDVLGDLVSNGTSGTVVAAYADSDALITALTEYGSGTTPTATTDKDAAVQALVSAIDGETFDAGTANTTSVVSWTGADGSTSHSTDYKNAGMGVTLGSKNDSVDSTKTTTQAFAEDVAALGAKQIGKDAAQGVATALAVNIGSVILGNNGGLAVQMGSGGEAFHAAARAGLVEAAALAVQPVNVSDKTLASGGTEQMTTANSDTIVAAAGTNQYDDAALKTIATALNANTDVSGTAGWTTLDENATGDKMIAQLQKALSNNDVKAALATTDTTGNMLDTYNHQVDAAAATSLSAANKLTDPNATTTTTTSGPAHAEDTDIINTDTMVHAGTAIGTNKSGDQVDTNDGTEGLTVTASTAGVKGQISGVTISISDSDGNVKKAANAALDQFSMSIRAENRTTAVDGNNNLTFQVGASANQSIAVSITDMRSEALGLKGSDGTKVSVATKDKANAAVAVFDNAIQKAIDQQTTIGAVEARLDYTSQNLTTSSENVQAAESTIRDADMAKEMTNYTKNNVLLQAAQSMLAQANQSSSQVLSLLQ